MAGSAASSGGFRRNRSRSAAALGLLVAYGIPLAQLVVAQLWKMGVISPEPNGPFIQTLQAGSGVAIFLTPVGLALIGAALHLRGAVAWLVLYVLGIGAGAVLWFVGAAFLGGLAGEPF